MGEREREREIFAALSLSLAGIYSFASRKIRASVAEESKINSGLLKKFDRENFFLEVLLRKRTR